MARGKHTVRVINTVKFKGEYHIPGEESAVFEVTATERKQLGSLVEDHDGDAPEVVESDLPDNLPGRAVLIEAGYASLDAIAEVEDLTSIDGIGAKTADAIEEYFAGDDEGDEGDQE